MATDMTTGRNLGLPGDWRQVDRPLCPHAPLSVEASDGVGLIEKFQPLDLFHAEFQLHRLDRRVQVLDLRGPDDRRRDNRLGKKPGGRLAVLRSPTIVMNVIRPIAILMGRLLGRVPHGDQAVRDNLLRQVQEATEPLDPILLRVDAGPHRPQPQVTQGYDFRLANSFAFSWARLTTSMSRGVRQSLYPRRLPLRI